MARIRSSASSRQSVIADAVRAVDFKHLWRQLLAAGWTSKRPSGLANEWTYFSPSGESFVGEYAVVAFVIESSLSVDSSGGSTECELEVKSFEDHGADDVVRASQIDTNIMLSTNTKEHMFASDDESIEKPANRELDVGAPKRLSSRIESNGDSDDGLSDTSDDDSASMEEGDRVTENAGVLETADDVNVMMDGDLSEGYESVCSGAA